MATICCEVLVVGAQPQGNARLSLEEEDAIIRRGFQPLIDTGLVEVTSLPHATPGSVQQLVSTQRFDVVHFIGHGVFDERRRSFLRFEDVRGESHDIGIRSARELLCGRGIRLVFLNACETARGGRVDEENSVAEALVKGGIGAVVANQYSVLDRSATEFAQYFYWALAHGQSLGRAAREARIAVNYRIDGESLDWAIPVLLARDPESRLCSERKATAETSVAIQASVKQSVRRLASRGEAPYRVAVWDVDGTYPGLNDTLDRMNDVQRRFHFDSVSLSMPIAALRRKTRRGKIQYDMDIASRRLRFATRELDVDYLLCIVDKLLMDKVDWDYYSWWKDNPSENNPLTFFSTDVKGLPFTGVDASRTIANAAVVGVIGAMTGIEARGDVPKDSILYDNDDIGLQCIIGHLQVDPKARRLLTQKGKGRVTISREDLKALTNILDAFW